MSSFGQVIVWIHEQKRLNQDMQRWVNVLYYSMYCLHHNRIRMTWVFFFMVPWASCQIRQIAGAHAPGMSGTFFPPPRVSKKKCRHASRHVLDARAVMHAGIATSRFPLNSAAGGNVPGIPGTCATRNFAYLVRGPLHNMYWVSNGCQSLFAVTCNIIFVVLLVTKYGSMDLDHHWFR